MRPFRGLFGEPLGNENRPARATLPSDRAGHLLAVAGVFLCLGFVTLGSTLVLLNNLEGETLRAQRGITADADQLVHELNVSMNSLMTTGVVDTDAFRNISASLERIFIEQATNRGLYASIQLVHDPPPESFRRPSRCLGYDPGLTTQGVVIGWESGSHRPGIAGAVYELHMTDGGESLHTLYYLKIFDCLNDVIFTHQAAHALHAGNLMDDGADRQEDDVSMDLVETNERTLLPDRSPAIDQGSLESLKWDHPTNLIEREGETADHASREDDRNHLRWRFTPPAPMQEEDLLLSPTVLVLAKHEYDEQEMREQDLVLNVYYPADREEPWRTDRIAPLGPGFDEYEIPMDMGPLGDEDWSRGEIENSLWELTVTGDHNPGRKVQVDSVEMIGDLWTWSAHRLDVSFDWEPIPPIYSGHELEMVYRIQPGTMGERFELLTRDVGPGGNATWWSLGTLEDTQGGWETFTAPLDLLGELEKNLEFRIVDLADDDPWVPDDEDTLEIDLMRVESRMNRP